jgi:phosphatidylglycerophosphate synthase
MRKIPEELENPIDSVLIAIVDAIQPYFYKMGFTPNILTTFSLLFWIGGLYFFIHNGPYYAYYAVLLMFISYFFDCFDGHFARSYDMVTKFGDYYDHISDAVKFALLFYFIVMIYGMKPIFILTFFAIPLCMHLRCQESYYNIPTQTLSFLNVLHISNGKENATNALKITKYFGCGTFYLIMFIYIIYLKSLPVSYSVSKLIPFM